MFQHVWTSNLPLYCSRMWLFYLFDDPTRFSQIAATWSRELGWQLQQVLGASHQRHTSYPWINDTCSSLIKINNAILGQLPLLSFQWGRSEVVISCPDFMWEIERNREKEREKQKKIDSMPAHVFNDAETCWDRFSSDREGSKCFGHTEYKRSFPSPKRRRCLHWLSGSFEQQVLRAWAEKCDGDHHPK